MKRAKVLGLALVAVFATSIAVTSAAEAAAGGPIWTTSAGSLVGSRNIGKVTGTTQNFTLPTVSVECPSVSIKSGATNTINGGIPGTGAATLIFAGCHPDGTPASACVVNGGGGTGGEIIFAVKTLLGYVEGKTEQSKSFYDQFFPNAETTGGKDLFVKLTFMPITTGGCKTFKGDEINVTAAGSEAPKPVGFGNRLCGMIAEVGKVKAGIFENATSGELVTTGALRLPEKPITKEETWNSETKAFVKTTCKLEANAGEARQSGEASFELEGGELFGVEI